MDDAGLLVLAIGAVLVGGPVVAIALGAWIGKRWGRPWVGGLAGGLAAPVLLVAVIASAWYQTTPSPQEVEDRDNEGVAASADALQRTVLAYAHDHGGRPPTWAELSTARGPGDRPYWPYPGVGGWAEYPPGKPAAPGGELVGVAARARGVATTPIGTTASEGRFAEGGRYDYRTFGAVVYDVDPEHRRWVIYGIGKLGAMASVEQALDETDRPTP